MVRLMMPTARTLSSGGFDSHNPIRSSSTQPQALTTVWGDLFILMLQVCSPFGAGASPKDPWDVGRDRRDLLRCPVRRRRWCGNRLRADFHTFGTPGSNAVPAAFPRAGYANMPSPPLLAATRAIAFASGMHHVSRPWPQGLDYSGFAGRQGHLPLRGPLLSEGDPP